MTLARHARGERFADLIVRGMLTELEWSIDAEEVWAQRTIGDEMERAARQLRAEGLQKCPTCRAFLSTEADWAHWRSLREAAIRKAQAREAAVPA